MEWMTYLHLVQVALVDVFPDGVDILVEILILEAIYPG